MGDKKSNEELLRDSLKDVIAISEKLQPFCQSVEEMIGVASLALENDAQLRILMAQMTSKAK